MLRIKNKIEISYNNLNMNNKNDKKLFNELEKILKKYGYNYNDNYYDDKTTKFYIQVEE